jgi:hypothetical protein
MKQMGPKNMWLVFCNLEQIISVNVDFLSMIESQIENISDVRVFTDIFVTMVSKLNQG